MGRRPYLFFGSNIVQKENTQKLQVVLRLPKGDTRKSQWPPVKGRLEDIMTRAWNNPVGSRGTLGFVEASYMETPLSPGEQSRVCLALTQIDPDIQDRVRENAIEVLERHFPGLPIGVKARDQVSGKLEPVE